MLANFGYFLSLGVMNVALPRFIEGPLGSTDVGVGIGVGSFTVTALLLRPWSGRFGDVRGRQWPIGIGAIIHAFAVAGMLLASSLVHVVALRLLTGVAEALFFVGVSTAAQDMAPDDRRGEAASLFSLSLFVALAIGPVIGETVLDGFGYKAVWGLAAAAATFGAVFALTIPDTRVNPGAGDGPGPLVHPAALRPGPDPRVRDLGSRRVRSVRAALCARVGDERSSLRPARELRHDPAPASVGAGSRTDSARCGRHASR